MSSAPLSYVPRPDTTPEREPDALAAVYGYLLKMKVARPAPEPDDRNAAKESKIVCDATRIIPE